MCLGVPLKIINIIDNEKAIAQLGEKTTLEINISLLDSVKEGDYVIVHAGFAISVLENEDATEIINIIKESNITQ
ncbi:MAG: HypC/HybG/HupF family hydrogenase formation chaperone [bacterium]|nr:HypC/HybG/HupF family hydrogenase formation chaperone [bacterium]